MDLFRDCLTGADYLRRVIELDDDLSPSEMSSLWQDKDKLPDFVAQHIGRTMKMVSAGSDSIRPFERTTISTNVQLFGAQAGDRKKSLLICFCGYAHRPMLPLAVFLQHIPEDRFDVLMIVEPSRYGYLKGVPEFGTDLVAVVDAIRERVPLDRYADIRCLGISAGGAAALYAGVLIGAERALSVCGRHRSLSSHVIGQPGRPPEFVGDEFDLMVRDRIAGSATRLLAAFGEDAAHDVEGAKSLTRSFPACHPVRIKGLAGHNALQHLLERDGLDEFFERFLLGDEIDFPASANAA